MKISLDEIVLNIMSALTIIPVVLYSIFLYYINRLEAGKCKCIQNYWDFKLMKYLLFILLPLSILFVAVIFHLINRNYYINRLPVILSFFGLIFIGVSIYYLYRTNDCECSNLWEKKLLKIYIYIYVIILVLSLIKIIK